MKPSLRAAFTPKHSRFVFLCVALFLARASSASSPENSSPATPEANPAIQGERASVAGQTLEMTVEAVLHSRGFQVVSYREWQSDPKAYGSELLLTDAPFETIYGHPGRSEFLLISEHYGLDIRIECKWQQSSGSVDEKFPYLLLNCIEQMPEQTIFIIVDGGGAKPGAVRWLREAAAEKRFQDTEKPKEIEVMNLSEFLIWVNQTLR